MWVRTWKLLESLKNLPFEILNLVKRVSKSLFESALLCSKDDGNDRHFKAFEKQIDTIMPAHNGLRF